MVCLTDFSGLVPRLDRHRLPPNAAVTARDVDLSRRTIAPWRTPKLVASLGEGIVNGHIRDCCWRGTSDCKTKFTDDVMGRYTYISNPCKCPEEIEDWCDGEPKVLGFPQPSPVVISGNPADGDDAFDELTTYYITYGDDCREGAPSRPSNAIKTDKTTGVSIAIPQPDDKYCVTKIYIYRSYSTYDVTQGFQSMNPDDISAGFLGPRNSETRCFLVGCVDVGVDTFFDPADDDDLPLGRMLLSFGYHPPVEGLMICGETDQKRLVGFKDDCVYFSEPNTPWGWPRKHKHKLPCKIRSVCVTGNFVMVMTEANPFVIVDNAECTTEASSQRDVIRSDHSFPLCNDKSVVCNGVGATFASEEGLIYLGPDGSTRIISRQHYGVNEWQAMHPTTMRAARYRDNYVATSAGGTIFFDANMRGLDIDSTQPLSTSCIEPVCWINDKNDALYFIDACGNVYEWNAGDDFLPYEYETAAFQFPGDLTLSAAQVGYSNGSKCIGTGCPSTVTFKAPDTPDCTFTPNSSESFRLNFQSVCELSICVCGTEPIYKLCFGSSLSELNPQLA